jgi:hypothetical protein
MASRHTPWQVSAACALSVVALIHGCDGAPTPQKSTSDAAARSVSDGGGGSEPAFPVSDVRMLPRGAPARHIQTLYDLGTDATSTLYDLSVDEGAVYWSQTPARLFAGSKDGRATPEHIGQWHRNVPAGLGIAHDTDHVYWLDKQELYRRAKSGGEAERITLDGEANGFTIGRRYIYVAAWGCPRITRIDKATLSREHIEVTLSSPGSGPTTLVEDGDELFCAAWSSVYVVRRWDEAAVRLTDSGERIWGAVVMGDYVYWLNRSRASVQPAIARVPRGGGSAEIFELEGSLLFNGATSLVREPNAERLWYSDGKLLISFDVATKRYAVRASEAPVAIALDDAHVYWASEFHRSAIRRMPLDAPVLYLTN